MTTPNLINSAELQASSWSKLGMQFAEEHRTAGGSSATGRGGAKCLEKVPVCTVHPLHKSYVRCVGLPFPVAFEQPTQDVKTWCPTWHEVYS